MISLSEYVEPEGKNFFETPQLRTMEGGGVIPQHLCHQKHMKTIWMSHDFSCRQRNLGEK